MLKVINRVVVWSIVIAFVLYYPTMISIHVKLPLLIGIFGYLFIKGLDGKGFRYIIIPLIYLLNLEINLSLPVMLSLFAVIVVYLTIYPKLIFLKRCPICIAIISVTFIDIFYFLFILLYDFIFSVSSIGVNSLLLFSLVTDIVLAVFV